MARYIGTHEALAGLSLSDGKLDSAVRVQQREVNRRAALYRQVELTDRTVIIVDDGLATGATFFAAVATVRRHHPRGVIGAIPVGARSSGEEARRRLTT
jgi:putative phosphoribosyl transferase